MTKDSSFVGVIHWLVSRPCGIHRYGYGNYITYMNTNLCIYNSYIYVSTLGFLSLKLKRHCTNFWGIFPSKTVPFFYIYMCVGFGKRWNIILYNKVCKIFRTTCLSNSQAKSAWTDFGESQQLCTIGEHLQRKKNPFNPIYTLVFIRK